MKRNKGITLIALIITIIVLLILAGVTLNMVIGENGIFSKANIAREKTNYTNAKETLSLKLMEIQTNCIIERKEYDLPEINNDLTTEEMIEMIHYYYKEGASLKSGIILDTNKSIKGIVVIVKGYEKYNFLIGEEGSIVGIYEGKFNESIGMDDFISLEQYESENNITDEEGSNEEIEEPDEEISKIIPGIDENIDITQPINLNTYMVVKTNTKNTLELENITNIKYSMQNKTSNLSLNGNVLIANSRANTIDSCIIKITGTYSGQSYTNTLTVYVEPNITEKITDKNGVEQDAYAIYNARDLVRYRELINHQCYTVPNAAIMNTIDLAGINWFPIGYYCYNEEEDRYYNENPLTGTIDGRNKVIKNLSIGNLNNNEIIEGVGFVGYLSNGMVKNIKFEDTNIDVQYSCFGVAVGEMDKNSKIENVHVVSGQIIQSNNQTVHSYVGAICGNAGSVEISKCSNSVDIDIYGFVAIGGIAGYGSEYVTITKCYNTGNVTNFSSNCGAVGGIVGSTLGDIESCYNLGNIDNKGGLSNWSNQSRTGGICGFIGNGTGSECVLQNCYNAGDISSTNIEIGGIVGRINPTGKVLNVYNSGNVIYNSNETTPITPTSTQLIGVKNNYVGWITGIKAGGTLSNNYANITQDNMKKWNEDTLNSKLGSEFVVNSGKLPKLSWQ